MIARLLRTLATAAVALAALTGTARAELAELNVAQQYGIGYLQLMLMEEQKLIEKHAKAAGLDVKVNWAKFAGGNVMNDALLSGSLQVASGGVGPIVTLWSRTRGNLDVRGIASLNSMPLYLVTRNPAVKTIKDFTDKDRIAVPTVRLSFNSMMLQMAAEELWKDPHRLDHLTVALGHPDAVSALSAGYGKAAITAHIAVQPFTDRGLKLPGAHIITDSRKVFGGPLTQITLLATKQTKEKNPTLFKAVANALDESIKVANADKRAAAVLWKEAQKAPDNVDDLVTQLNDPGFEFTSEPHRIAFFAAFLNRIGTMKAKVGDWKELFWETAHQRQGD